MIITKENKSTSKNYKKYLVNLSLLIKLFRFDSLYYFSKSNECNDYIKSFNFINKLYNDIIDENLNLLDNEFFETEKESIPKLS